MISVIMPVYNAANFIGASIASILAQTLKDFELIIVNDGSTDESHEVILSFKDERIRYVRQENLGVAAAREAALRLARGEFVTFQDADDISLPNRFQMLRDCFIANSIGLVHSDVLLIDEADRPVGYWASGNIGRSRLLRFFLKVGTPFNNPTLMLRRQAVAEFRYDRELRIGEDTDMVFAIAPHWHAVHIPEPLVLYRRYAASLSHHGDYDAHVLHLRKFLAKHSLQSLFPELEWHRQEECCMKVMAASLVALFLARRGYGPDAVNWFNFGQSLECGTAARQFAAGIAGIISGDFEHAVLALNKCDSCQAVTQNYLGEAAALQGDFTQALAHFMHSMRLNPVYFEPVENIKALGMCRGVQPVDAAWSKFINKGGNN